VPTRENCPGRQRPQPRLFPTRDFARRHCLTARKKTPSFVAADACRVVAPDAKTGEEAQISPVFEGQVRDSLRRLLLFYGLLSRENKFPAGVVLVPQCGMPLT
jgi:hypothetical protein